MILTKPKFIAQARVDLEDLNVLFSGLTADEKFKTKAFWSATQQIFKGFAVSGLGSPSPALVDMTDATLLNAGNSGEFSWFSADTGASAISVPLVANVRNYLELSLSTVDGTPLSRAFWDPSANGGLGAEFNQTVNTVTNIQCSVVVLQGGFSNSANRIQLATVDTDSGNNIKLIRDKRPLFGRLGTPAAPLGGYSWATQTEPELTLNLTSVVGTFVVGETVTIGSQTATVSTGGTTSIGVILLSSDSIASGNAVLGGTSGATGTLNTALDSFIGADKSLSNQFEINKALMTEIRRLKGTDFWFQVTRGSVNGLADFSNSIITPITSGASISWDGSSVSITDSSGSPSSADVVGRLRIFGNANAFDLKRQDGTGGSTVLALSDGEVLFLALPSSGARAYSGAGAATGNYQKVAKASFVQSDTNYWIAYREGAKLFFRGTGALSAGAVAPIGDPAGALQSSLNAEIAARTTLQSRFTDVYDAVVGAGSECTDATIAAAITRCSAGARILVVDSFALSTSVAMSKANMLLELRPSVVISAGAATVGFTVTAAGCMIRGGKISGFTTGIDVQAGGSRFKARDIWFSSNTDDMPDALSLATAVGCTN